MEYHLFWHSYDGYEHEVFGDELVSTLEQHITLLQTKDHTTIDAVIYGKEISWETVEVVSAVKIIKY